MRDLRPDRPVISFTFDDFPQSALQEGGAVLQEYGVCGTYYVSLGFMGRSMPAGPGFEINDLGHLLACGHELGCHTFCHCDSWKTEPFRFEAAIGANREVLARMFPRARFKSFSYPIACPRPETKRRAAKHFACCRGGVEGFNVGPTDASNLRAFFLEKQHGDRNLVKRLIRENCAATGWLIFATHDIGTNPTSLGCTTRFFEEVVSFAVASGAAVLPVSSAWETICGDFKRTTHAMPEPERQ